MARLPALARGHRLQDGAGQLDRVVAGGADLVGAGDQVELAPPGRGLAQLGQPALELGCSVLSGSASAGSSARGNAAANSDKGIGRRETPRPPPRPGTPAR
jgi:hypothetical protein